MKVVIYSRVSTNLQDYKRQTEELLEFSKNMNYEVSGIFEEKISGGKINEERPELLKMINYVKANKIDKVLCWEISRIGRNTIEVLKTIQLLNKNCISLYIKNHKIETLDDNCEINPMSQFLIQILTSISEMEKNQIRQRIKSGYDSYRKNGGKVGRKDGFRKDKEILLTEYKDVVKLLKQGYSVRKTMKLTDKSSGTVQKIKKILND
ncbi:recombinase family protein [Flavobacterium sp. MC2016-06]|jgi:DNA invertase Pin-like site-specific DNA recombinase|uniref:recombinase family protein n=1 Tax=Flavobacterium sp. MC2016-06 TaxID=2676308 RepID=UPI0012BA6AF0|nr:recombinase family protein [Flavobacterium sp. MC2016-06]MBU3859090.1 recombinase family protein [Flavobacterium sp. MC2016-06]